MLYVTQKYCELYDYMFLPYRRMLDGLGIRCLQMTFNGAKKAGAALAIEIDVGSIYTKYCVLDGRMELFSEQTSVR